MKEPADVSDDGKDEHDERHSRAEKIDTTLSIDKREIGGLGLLLVQEKSESMKYEYRNHCNITTLTV